MSGKQLPDVTPWGTCLYCGRRCHVPVSRSMPRHVQDAFAGAGMTEMATCEDGAAADQRRLGVSYADVIEARVRELGHPHDSNLHESRTHAEPPAAGSNAAKAQHRS